MFFPSPVQISAKLENLSEYELSLMCNREMLRINQDSLCDYPRLLGDISSDECRIYKRTLSDGGKAFAVFNMSEKTLNTKLDFGGKYRIRDPWQSVFLGEADSYLCKTAPHSATVIRLFPL